MCEEALLSHVEEQNERLNNKALLCCDRGVSELEGYYCPVDSDLFEQLRSSIKEKQSVIVYGDSGIGKSSAMYLLYKELYNEYKKPRDYSLYSTVIPVMIERDDFENYKKDANQYLFTKDTDYSKLDNVCFLIDSIDELFTNDNISELNDFLNSLRKNTVIIFGRTKIAKLIHDSHINYKPIELKSNEYIVDQIVEKYSNYSGSDTLKQSELDKISNFIKKSKIFNPLLIALIIKYYKGEGCSEKWFNREGTLVRALLYRHVFQEMLRPKKESIIKALNDKNHGVTLDDDCFVILCEFAWIRYKGYRSQTDSSIITAINKSTGFDERLISMTLDIFTYLDSEREYQFLHKSFEEYFTASWVMKTIRNKDKNRYKELKGVMLRTDVQRFIGDHIYVSDCDAYTLKEWYSSQLKKIPLGKDGFAEGKDMVTETKLLYSYGRLIIASETTDDKYGAKGTLMEYYEKYKQYNSPQLFVVMNSLIQGYDLSVESEAVHLMEGGGFGLISRVCYSYYKNGMDQDKLVKCLVGRIDYPDADMVDIVEMFKVDLFDEELRHRCLRRVETVLLRQYLENGYKKFTSEDINYFASLSEDTIVNDTMSEDFKKQFEKQQLEYRDFSNSFRAELIKLKDVAKKRLKELKKLELL